MNLSAGQQWRNRHRKHTYGHGEREERVRRSERVTWKLTLPYVKQTDNRNLRMAQETHTGALYQSRGMGWGGKWEGGSKWKGYMYTYG